MKVAKDGVVLSKRVGRFLTRECRRDRGLAELLDVLGGSVRAYLFGGVLRDIALRGIRSFDSDIDAVFLGHRDSLSRYILKAYPTTKQNRFGGYRVETERWFVDIWEARETWAFRSGHRHYSGIRSLLDTTITNWESVLYRLDGGRLICRDGYFEQLSKGYLDVVLDANPNRIGMQARLLRMCADKEVALLSRGAVEALRTGLEAYSFDEIAAYERLHFRETRISESTYEYLKGRIFGVDKDGGRVALAERQRDLSL